MIMVSGYNIHILLLMNIQIIYICKLIYQREIATLNAEYNIPIRCVASTVRAVLYGVIVNIYQQTSTTKIIIFILYNTPVCR